MLNVLKLHVYSHSTKYEKYRETHQIVRQTCWEVSSVGPVSAD